MENCKCIICGTDAAKAPINDVFHYECPNCGKFCVSHDFEDRDIDIHEKIAKHLLSGYIREQNEYGKEDTLISNKNVFDILGSPIIPKSIEEKEQKFLLALERRTKYLSQPVKDNEMHYPSICYAYNKQEAQAIIRSLIGNNLIKSLGSVAEGYALTYKGLKEAQKLKLAVSNSAFAFVAMWFNDEEMKDVFESAIKPAVQIATEGQLTAFRVDNKEHNNDITDEIIAGIKDSRFVIADMTGYRGGVYYEAGFARGLGKPVILTCRKDWFDGETDCNGKVIKEKIHFDINHLNVIVWNTLDELKKRLISRIKATVL